MLEIVNFPEVLFKKKDKSANNVIYYGSILIYVYKYK